MLPAAPFRLSSADLTLADKRALNVRVPVGYGWKPCAFFCKRPYLKSHDWQQVKVHVYVCLTVTVNLRHTRPVFARFESSLQISPSVSIKNTESCNVKKNPSDQGRIIHESQHELILFFRAPPGPAGKSGLDTGLEFQLTCKF